MVDVKGKWCFITGASRGVGRQIALCMAERGAHLILHSRSVSHTEKVLDEVSKFGIEAFAIEAELSQPDEVKAMLQKIDASGKNVEIVFNDAGVQIAYRQEYYQTPVADFTQSFLINTIAPVMICYHFLPKMTERGFGRIINTTSGIRNEPQQAGYSASKAALDKLTTDLASVLDGTDVCLSLADPGWIRTDLGGPHAPGAVESCLPGVAVGAFINDKKSGRLFPAPRFHGMTLEQAVQAVESGQN
ncbi:MAG: SDR family oxidoreductase [Treponema sp.]|jgi:short-subunit dehydrogenase|nr:SDR family oxidoreductase [Treponema sp.]